MIDDSHARRILGWSLGAFLAPPAVWLAGIWFFDLCSFDQVVAVALTPALAAYVVVYTGGTLALFHRHLTRIVAARGSGSRERQVEARRSIALLPRLFLAAMTVYCLIGPNTALYDKSFFATPTTYLLAWAIGIAIIFVFSVPFFIAMVADLERLSVGIPVTAEHRSLSVSGKMTIIFLFTIVGAGLTVSIGSLAVVTMRAGEPLFGILAAKLAGAGVVLVAVATLNMVVTVRQILMPIRRIATQMERVAAGDDTLRIEGGDIDDEVGDIARAFQANARRIWDILEAGRARDASAEAQRQDELGRVAADFERSVAGVVEGVATAAAEMLAASTQLGETAEQTTRKAAGVSATAQQTSANVRTVAAATEGLSASISDIGRQMADSAAIARRAVAQADDTRQRVGELSAAASKIGDVIRLIQEIAAQTNLLALNATIEAARAGEAGKGFAVVATEVKTLAGQTGRATEDIATQIAAIQEATGNTVSAIDDIGSTIRRIDEISADIAAAVARQSAATSEINTNVAQAALGTEDIDGSIVGVSEAARRTATASSKVADNCARLSRQSDELRHEVEHFLGTLRRA